MAFLNPTYLWALLGILIPVAIHFWSRKKVMTIKVGSTQLLSASQPKQTSSIRLNEWWLLLLRILIVGLLTLLLAGPVFTNKIARKDIVYLIEPTLVDTPVVQKLLDSLPSDEIRILANGFPQVADFTLDEANFEVPEYWQLDQEMYNLNADSIVVFTNAFISGVKGKRPEVRSPAKWIVLDQNKSQLTYIGAVVKEDSVAVMSAISSSKHLNFSKELYALQSDKIVLNATNDSLFIAETGVLANQEKGLNVTIHYTDSLSNEVRYYSAAFTAISRFLNRPISIDSHKNPDSLNLAESDLAVYLGTSPKVKINATNPTLIFKQDSFADHIIAAGENENIYYLTSRLNSENSVEEKLTQELLGLFDLEDELISTKKRYDFRTLDTNDLTPNSITVTEKKSNYKQSDASLWLWILLLPLMVMNEF